MHDPSPIHRSDRRGLTYVSRDRAGCGVEVQGSGPADRPGSKLRPGRAFRGTQTKSAGLMLGSGVVITMLYVLAAGLRAVHERCLLGSMLGSSDFVWCRSGLGLEFPIHFCISSVEVPERQLQRTSAILVASSSNPVKSGLPFRTVLSMPTMNVNEATSGPAYPREY